jgi:hypothetical protein
MNSLSPHSTWPEALATVLSCTYDFGAGRALVGIPTDKHFRIAYNYNAPGPSGHDELHTGEFSAAKPMPQGTLFPIRYNPDSPHDHTHPNAHSTTTRPPILLIGILGSLILSLAWFAVLRGCH